MTTINDIKAVIKEPSERLKYLADTVDRQKHMQQLAVSEWGKILLKELEDTRQGCISRLLGSLWRDCSLDYLKGVIAELKVCYDMIERIETRKHVDATQMELEKEFKEEIV